jgi:hypothetical protein
MTRPAREFITPDLRGWIYLQIMKMDVFISKLTPDTIVTDWRLAFKLESISFSYAKQYEISG